jgi:heme A synthase
MTHRLFDAWAARQRRRQSSHGPHPTLWVVLAIVSALLGAATSVWRNADTELALGFADSVPAFVGTLLGAEPANGKTHATPHPHR